MHCAAHANDTSPSLIWSSWIYLCRGSASSALKRLEGEWNQWTSELCIYSNSTNVKCSGGIRMRGWKKCSFEPRIITWASREKGSQEPTNACRHIVDQMLERSFKETAHVVVQLITNEQSQEPGRTHWMHSATRAGCKCKSMKESKRVSKKYWKEEGFCKRECKQELNLSIHKMEHAEARRISLPDGKEKCHKSDVLNKNISYPNKFR